MENFKNCMKKQKEIDPEAIEKISQNDKKEYYEY